MIDAALVAYAQYSGRRPPAEVAARMVLKALDLGLLANVTAIERAERIADAIMEFQTNVLRCAPLLRGLGRGHAPTSFTGLISPVSPSKACQVSSSLRSSC